MSPPPRQACLLTPGHCCLLCAPWKLFVFSSSTSDITKMKNSNNHIPATKCRGPAAVARPSGILLALGSLSQDSHRLRPSWPHSDAEIQAGLCCRVRPCHGNGVRRTINTAGAPVPLPLILPHLRRRRWPCPKSRPCCVYACLTFISYIYSHVRKIFTHF